MIESRIENESVVKYMLTSVGTVSVPQSITSSGSVFSLDSVAQGTTNQTRVGNNAYIKNIWINLNCYADSTDVINVFRILLVRWTDVANLTMPDVLTSNTNYINSFYNTFNISSGKLHVMADHTLNTGTTAGGSRHWRYDKEHYFTTKWNNTTAIPAIDNSLWLVVVSDSTAIPSPQCSGACAITFEQ